ncbi:hypothetical protein PR202_ga22373 [Eleusine coracana subsp. coracana]|uniref:Myb/SANT-like domain-containing protein n=1 Tax=Eleusine coracana subsp. coracana TaxID=191504 RepID=A0AAV5D1I7_ELECO|nr:hypothetical protein PR202_ga22373 [Eleusine coracana subsp. coracana]
MDESLLNQVDRLLLHPLMVKESQVSHMSIHPMSGTILGTPKQIRCLLITKHNVVYKCNANDMEKGKKVSRGYVPWDDEIDKVLQDTFVEHYKKGDRCQNSWKSHVYTAAIKNVREKCGVNIAKSNIESRSKTKTRKLKAIGTRSSNIGTLLVWQQFEKVESDDSFTSALFEKIDGLTVVLKEDTTKLPSSAEVLAALREVDGLDEDTVLDLYDILTTDARKFESMIALPAKMRKRWLLKQLKKLYPFCFDRVAQITLWTLAGRN